MMRKLITAGAAALLAAGCVSVLTAPRAAAANGITVNGTQGGRTFDGSGRSAAGAAPTSLGEPPGWPRPASA